MSTRTRRAWWAAAALPLVAGTAALVALGTDGGDAATRVEAAAGAAGATAGTDDGAASGDRSG
ncbi:hypothetical protein, partial [Actinotalea ferrariae]|uniref:hypothetical protein n=1 Tax=Actinotalea ferrariae TaxID=1386098 RepID=UPI001C1E8778